jgi:protein-S-isoprenylcysteine O-methyltransferase
VHIETSATHKLVRTGIYRVVRHPAYLGLVSVFLGIPLSEGSWGGTIVAVAGGIPAVVYRIWIEEKSLSEWFGEQYEEYKESSWRLIPYLW